MDKLSFWQKLRKPFQSQWNFLFLTIFFCLSSIYFINLYSNVHWGVIFRNGVTVRVNTSMALSKILGAELNTELNNDAIEEFQSECEAKGWSELSDEFKALTAPLDKDTRSVVELLCGAMYAHEKSMHSAFGVLSSTGIYHLFGFLAFISSVVCIIISQRRKVRLAGIIAIPFGLLGGFIAITII